MKSFHSLVNFVRRGERADTVLLLRLKFRDALGA
jgi:hypothetical protein